MSVACVATRGGGGGACIDVKYELQCIDVKYELQCIDVKYELQ